MKLPIASLSASSHSEEDNNSIFITIRANILRDIYIPEDFKKKFGVSVRPEKGQIIIGKEDKKVTVKEKDNAVFG